MQKESIESRNQVSQAKPEIFWAGYIARLHNFACQSYFWQVRTWCLIKAGSFAMWLWKIEKPLPGDACIFTDKHGICCLIFCFLCIGKQHIFLFLEFWNRKTWLPFDELHAHRKELKSVLYQCVRIFWNRCTMWMSTRRLCNDHAT